ncbi:uncharacterized protein LOC143032384 [Oratosquilla oratoria]|uniref:uncharacterized protein LOC143032384 n=1 Tax=Oratosquilla oratoria TaxID=337810 RepID=UPI003F7641FD
MSNGSFSMPEDPALPDPISDVVTSTTSASVVSLEEWEKLQRNITVTPIQVEVNTMTQVMTLLTLTVGVVGNLMLVCVLLAAPRGKRIQVVDRILLLLGLTGLGATLASTPIQLYAYAMHEFPRSESLCQAQGYMLNLLSLLALWYTNLLAIERYVKFRSPHEHALTFSILNLNVIVSGLLVILLIEVCGPIYGWAEYRFAKESTACMVDPLSQHFITYVSIHATCYVGVPALISAVAIICVLRWAFTDPTHLLRGSQYLKCARDVVVLCGAMLTTLLLLLPCQLLLFLQALEVQIPTDVKVAAFWFQMIGLSWVYPAVPFLARPAEAWAALGRIAKSPLRLRFSRHVDVTLEDSEANMSTSTTVEIRSSSLLAKYRRGSSTHLSQHSTRHSVSSNLCAKDIVSAL